MKHSAYLLAAQQLNVRKPCLSFAQLKSVCRRLLWLRDRNAEQLRLIAELRVDAATRRKILILPARTPSQAVYAAAVELVDEQRRLGYDTKTGAIGALAQALKEMK